MRWLALFLLTATTALTTATTTAQAEPEIYTFTWLGGGDHVLNGAMMFDPAETPGQMVTEAEVQCFWIEASRGGKVLGAWGLGALLPETTWILTFDRQLREFPVFPARGGMPQAWNMNGGGYNCGTPGVGFNIGNAAQDICVDGQLVIESQVTPTTPLPASRVADFDFSPGSCREALLMGQLN